MPDSMMPRLDADHLPVADGDGAPTSSLLRPGVTCWRVERAGRAAFLVDGAAYYAAARAAMLRARHSIMLLAWDFDPRVRLEPDNPENDGADIIGRFLDRLVAERPALRVHVLRWRMPLPLVFEHPNLPLVLEDWRSDARLRYRLDARHPAGACHHQKILVIDDAVAFCGGMDFAGNRWDTPEHRDDDPRRRRPNGEPYAPRHDLMMAVDGPAAAALGELARERWRRATGVRLPQPPAGSDPWPERLEPSIRDVPVGIARTEPAWRGRPEVREVESLYFDAIAAARRTLYLESQYFAAPPIAEALAARLAEPDGPEVVVINTTHSPSWFDRAAMDTARGHVVKRLRAADRHGRFRILAPVTAGGTPIIVHSKIMAVDDRLLRIGSSNVNLRSMGFDTECDLAIEAAPGNAEGGAAIRRFRNRLLAEHLGTTVERVADAVAGSLIGGIDALRRDTGRLVELPPSRMGLIGTAIGTWHLLDPQRTRDAWRPWQRPR